ncbi:MAG: hypothetical protein JWR08_2410 [Enterovirga sp.]|nr:hypothetical protein [Enterovirga sp.]
MIYLDSSVALAHILSETRRPPAEFWLETTMSSRLLEYEVWNRVHAYDMTAERSAATRDLLEIVEYVDMSAPGLLRALRPFPLPVRTLDGLHLATMDHLRGRGIPLTLASYDVRLLAAAEALGFATVQP